MTSAFTVRPEKDEYGGGFANYVKLMPESDILAVLSDQLAELPALLLPIKPSEAAVRHPPYTWTINQVVGHLIDCERIFGFRALCAARGDATALPGFDENEYVRQAHFDEVACTELVAEWQRVRESHLYFFRHLDESAWTRRGAANGVTVSVRAWAYVIAGHTRHHLTIMRGRLMA